VSADGQFWFLLNASPDVRQQIEAFPPLHPRALRATAIAGIVLTSGDLDHCLGLLSLRESQPLVVYATERVRRGFCEQNRLYRTLERFPRQITWRTLELGSVQPLRAGDGESGLALCALPLPGKSPLHLADLGSEPGDNVGLRIVDRRRGSLLSYLPSVAGPCGELSAVMHGAAAVFFDGTFWSNDELTGQGLGLRDARAMSHWPIGGARGSLPFLRDCAAKRRILIHINNTNPILREDSPERAELDAASVEVAHDGMELEL